MNLLKGYLNPLEMYLSIAQMDDERAKIKSIRIIIVTIVIASLLSVLPMFVINVPTEQYLLHSLANNCQIFGYCILFPFAATLTAKLFVKMDLKKNKSSSKHTDFFKTFLISMTSMTYVVFTVLVFMFEISMLLAFTMSKHPSWMLMTVSYTVLILMFFETVLVFIWYVYKPFTAIYQCSSSAIFKRILMAFIANIAAVIPCNVVVELANGSYGIQSVVDNTMISSASSTHTLVTPQQKTAPQIVLNSQDTDLHKVDTKKSDK